MNHSWFALFLFLTPMVASATPPPPPLVKGQYVYTIPSDYRPDGLSDFQVQQLNGELGNLHFPFYVVVYKDVPELDSDDRAYARTNGFTGDENTLRIEVTTARLMERWAASEAGYNPGTTSVFVLGTNPRKFAWHPALNWKNGLGLDRRAQDPYTQEFLRAAKTKPADLGRGIANLARKLDEYAFDQTDPGRIAQRAEIARQQAEARRLQAAQGALDTEIIHLAELLKDPDYLPADSDSYKGTLAKAKGVRATNDPNLMLAEAEQMKGTVAVLDKYVSEAKSAARMVFLGALVKWLLILTLVGVAVFLVVRRRRAQKALIRAFQDEYTQWTRMVTNARNRWSDLYLKRDDIIGLDKVTGKTAALWASTTKAVDDILVRIEAMDRNLRACKALFDKGHYLNFRSFEQAIAALDAPFTFDTGTLNEADLFGGETVTLQVVPRKFADETKALFAASIDGWKRLQKAASERHGPVEEDFPHTNLDEMFAQAKIHNIPERWFSEHPLFGDDASDAHFYEGLAASRDSDPLAYVEKLEELRRAETNQMLKMRALIGIRERVNLVRLSSPFDTKGTVVSPDDDPTVTIAAARQAEAKLDGLIATATSTDEVQNQCDVVVDLYRKCAKQGAELKSAIEGCRNALQMAEAKGKEAEAAAAGALTRVANARSLFKRLEPAEGSLKAANSYIEKGNRKLKDCLKAIEDTRHLAARRLADEASNAFTQAIESCNAARSHVSGLEKERARFLERASGLGGVRSSFERKMRGLGNHARNLPPANVQMPDTSKGPVDFALLLMALDSQESHWRTECRRAEEAYEEEQRCIRRRHQEEEARRRREEEEDRQRRSSYHHSSSSSSSSDSWGGGGFGGSSGDSGGGGFGGSSGDY